MRHCIDYIDLNEPFAVPPYGHVTHLDCMALHNITMIGGRTGGTQLARRVVDGGHKK